MPYTVQFVGLVCFYREPGGRQALLPDGRRPPAGVEPHVASIEVAPEDVLDVTGWNGSEDAAHGRYLLPPCSIELEGADVPGPLDTSLHDDYVPRLARINPEFEIDPDRAETIARLRVRRGVLQAFRIPGGDATISQLDVPHDGEIQVRVTPRDGSPERRLRLRAGTEVLIANMAESGYLTVTPKSAQDSHFRIYEKLSTRQVTLHEPESIPAVPPSQSQHATFLRGEPIALSTDCTNTGCCP
jgi:hypothetical protein